MQDFKLKLKTLERRRLDYDSDRRAFARLEAKKTKALNSGTTVKPEITTQLQSKEHTMAGTGCSLTALCYELLLSFKCLDAYPLCHCRALSALHWLFPCCMAACLHWSVSVSLWLSVYSCMLTAKLLNCAAKKAAYDSYEQEIFEELSALVSDAGALHTFLEAALKLESSALLSSVGPGPVSILEVLP